MPGRILTDTERETWNQFPLKIASSDLVTYFTLSTAELDLACQHRGAHNRLGFALQLLTLRYLGFCPERLATTPEPVVAYVAQQLSVTPDVLVNYGERAQTRTEHTPKKNSSVFGIPTC